MQAGVDLRKLDVSLEHDLAGLAIKEVFQPRKYRRAAEVVGIRKLNASWASVRGNPSVEVGANQTPRHLSVATLKNWTIVSTIEEYERI